MELPQIDNKISLASFNPNNSCQILTIKQIIAMKLVVNINTLQCYQIKSKVVNLDLRTTIT